MIDDWRPDEYQRPKLTNAAYVSFEGMTMAAEPQALVRALVAFSVDKGNVSTSLKGLEAKGLVTITRTPGGRAEAVDLTPEGRHRVAALTVSCE
jgi:DNA-binding MarR family transcriptional regulator